MSTSEDFDSLKAEHVALLAIRNAAQDLRDHGWPVKGPWWRRLDLALNAYECIAGKVSE